MCDGLNDTHGETSGVCTEDVGDDVNACRGGQMMASWAVGGEVSLNKYTTLLNNL